MHRSSFSKAGILLAACGLLCTQAGAATGAEDIVPPSLQDLQIAGRVISFQTDPPSRDINLAVVYAGSDPSSREEARSIAGLLVDGLPVGDLVLRPRPVEQRQLSRLVGIQAIFACSGVDQARLQQELARRRVLCLTRHLDQVERGACAVAISSSPEVSIAVNKANASVAHIRFATAFLMMVHEL